MAKAPVLGNDPFLRGAAQHPAPAPSPRPDRPRRKKPPRPRSPPSPSRPGPPERRPGRRPRPRRGTRPSPARSQEARSQEARPQGAAEKEPAQKQQWRRRRGEAGGARKRRAAAPPPRAPKPERVEEREERAGPAEGASAAELDRQASEEAALRDHLPLCWFDRARHTATSVADQAVQFLLANALAQRTLESLMANPVTHKVAGAAAKAVSSARPALDIALSCSRRPPTPPGPPSPRWSAARPRGPSSPPPPRRAPPCAPPPAQRAGGHRGRQLRRGPDAALARRAALRLPLRPLLPCGDARGRLRAPGGEHPGVQPLGRAAAGRPDDPHRAAPRLQALRRPLAHRGRALPPRR
jgi:hypothetical protein